MPEQEDLWEKYRKEGERWATAQMLADLDASDQREHQLERERLNDERFDRVFELELKAVANQDRVIELLQKIEENTRRG